ncbi:hypothetical protein [Archangium sp.]|uniref:hypothetical protein n=1 Tax=Archangium sp. TaxID=1872627 RepID=UPI002D423DED|nr:hypothetical protein [Archangium sp.]HYO56582.1 hypothetical protein [Archangium sp.]
MFNHLAGIAMAPTVRALADRGALELLTEAPGWVVFDEIVKRTRANRGYLRVALRLMASSGWLSRHVEQSGRDTAYQLTAKGRLALEIAPQPYGEVVAFLPKAISFEDHVFGASNAPLVSALSELVERACQRWGIRPGPDTDSEEVRDQVRGHLDGVLVGPVMVVLPQAGVEEASVAPQAVARKEPMKEKTPRVDWAELLRRTFDLDVFACVRCGGRRRVLAYVMAYA